jgi:hypothetical protein
VLRDKPTHNLPTSPQREASMIRRHAHHPVWRRVQRDRFSNHGWIGAEAPLPKSVAEDHYGIVGPVIVERPSCSPDLRHPENLKQIARDHLGGNGFGLTGGGDIV